MNRVHASLALALWFTGCNLLWGVGDLTYESSGGAGTTTSSSPDGGGGAAGAAGQGGGGGAPESLPSLAHRHGTLDVAWQFGSSVAMWSVDQFVCVRQRAPATGWKLWLTFAGASGTSYVEVEANGPRQDGSQGDTARFQADHANAARGAFCPSEPSATEGYLCERTVTLEMDRCYRLRVWRLEADSDGQWWGAWIRDEETLVEEEIGGLRLDLASTEVTAVSNTARYRGPAMPCDAVPTSIADLSEPGANVQGEQLYEFLGSLAATTLGTCIHGTATETDLGWATAAHVVLGGSP